MLYDFMLNDPDVSSYSPLKVQDTYNDIVETFPELAKKRKIMRAVLRKSLAQGGNLDIYEIKDLIGANKDLTQQRALHSAGRKELKGNLSSRSSDDKPGKSGDSNSSPGGVVPLSLKLQISD